MVGEHNMVLVLATLGVFGSTPTPEQQLQDLQIQDLQL